jgi:hypothetical protein
MTVEMKITRLAEKLQIEGTKEFDAAISGPGPLMPERDADAVEDAELTRALKDSFPASDPIAGVSAATKVGKPLRTSSKP